MFEDPILLLTDAEPDDLLALFLLISFKVKISAILVSESVPTTTALKTISIKRLLKLVNYDCDVIPCFSSKKDYDLTLDSELTIEEQNLVSDYVADPIKYNNFVIELTKMFITMFKNPTIICIAPIRMLFAMYHENIKVFRNVTAYIYGSFNFREVLRDIDSDINLTCMLNSGFKNLYVFENHHVLGEQNSFNKNTCPKTYKMFEELKDDKVIKHISYIMFMWNKNIIKKCAEFLLHKHIPKELKPILQKIIDYHELTPKEIEILNNTILKDDLNRAFKIIINIINSSSFQIVASDACLILSILNKEILNELYVNSLLSFDKNFITTSTINESSNVKFAIAKNLEKRGELMNIFDEIMEDILQTRIQSKL